MTLRVPPYFELAGVAAPGVVVVGVGREVEKVGAAGRVVGAVLLGAIVVGGTVVVAMEDIPALPPHALRIKEEIIRIVSGTKLFFT
jgi:hypothetical protein